jgi:hypothetical protein
MRDSDPTPGVPAEMRYGGFESGLRHSDGEPKLAYEGFRLPLVARIAGPRRDRATLWGHVRPARAATTVTIDRRPLGARRWHVVKRVRSGGLGYWSAVTRHHKGERYRVRWTAPDGRRDAGPATRVTLR